MVQSEFLRCLTAAQKRLKRSESELARTQSFARRNDMAGAFGAAFAFEAEVEKLTLLARAMPAYTGNPKAAEITEALMGETIPIEIGYTQQGWFCLRLPALLPKKEHGSPIYIQQALYPAMQRFFVGKIPCCYPDCVLIYRHVYDARRPERAYRDHDNIELNMVTDIVALYMLPDDAPKQCAHFYCSAVGTEDRTEVYVVPRDQFPTWLYASFHNRLEEVILYEAQP